MKGLADYVLDDDALLDIEGLAVLPIDTISSGGFDFYVTGCEFSTTSFYSIVGEQQQAANYKVKGYHHHTTGRFEVSGEQSYQEPEDEL